MYNLSERLLADYDRLEQHGVIFEVPGWSLVRLSGSDRRAWLQGQVTNDVRLLEHAQSFETAFCDGTGHLEGILHIWSEGATDLIASERATASKFLVRVEENVFLEDVTAHLVEGLGLISVQGANTEIWARSLGASVVLRSNRSIFGGWDVWGSQHIPEEALACAELAEVARIEAGLPRLGLDYTLKTLASELGPAFQTRAISYTKGCYTGQEVLMRIHSQGHTNRTWIGLRSSSELNAGGRLTDLNGVDVGWVASCAVSPKLGHIGSGIVRNEYIAAGNELWAGGKGPVTVHPMPLRQAN